MQDTQLNRISNFIWSISDDVLRDIYVRGKYRDVILPMTVLRRLDAVLEPTKQKVLDDKKFLDEARITDQDDVLRQASQHAFYNTSQFTMRDLAARATQQSLRADFEAYLDGYSPNVQDIIDRFQFRNQMHTLTASDTLGTMRTPKRHVFEFPFEIPASKTARSGRPRAKHVQHNNASEQLDHQL